MILYDSDLKIFYSTLINDDKFFSGFGSRDIGDGRRVDNIFSFLNNNQLEYQKIVIPEQIHSTNVQFFKSSNNERIEKIIETDGAITKDKSTVLTVVTADCCPLIFADKVNGVIGISHQGWRGSVKRMAQKMVDKFVEAGSRVEEIKVAIGPSIGECCYDIDDDRYYEFREEFDGYTDKIFHLRGGKRHLNLARLNYLLLLEKGVNKKNIDFFPFCTSCDKKRFFSFRRDKKLTEGEMLSYILTY